MQHEQERKQSHFVKYRKEFVAHLCSNVSQLGKVEVKRVKALSERQVEGRSDRREM